MKAYIQLRKVIAAKFHVNLEAVTICISYDKPYIKYHAQSVATRLGAEYLDEARAEEREMALIVNLVEIHYRGGRAARIKQRRAAQGS